jgi:hypothetical protein
MSGWANMDHLSFPWDVMCTKKDLPHPPTGKCFNGFFPENALELSCMRMRIEAKEEQQG